MVELANSNDLPGIDQVAAGAARMLDAGVEKAELLSMFQTIVDQHEAVSPGVVAPKSYDENTVFDELPDGLIDFPSASKKYRVAMWSLRNWVRDGHLARCGRLKGPAPGGGYCVVNEEQLKHHMANRRRPGRPPRG